MSSEDAKIKAEEARIRARLNKRYQEWHGFAIHAVIYLMVNVIVWGFWGALHFFPALFDAFASLSSYSLATALGSIILPLVITLGWGLGLVAHYVHYYIEHGPGADRHEAHVQREIERYKARVAGYEKLKNDEHSHLELNDDGEIESTRNLWSISADGGKLEPSQIHEFDHVEPVGVSDWLRRMSWQNLIDGNAELNDDRFWRTGTVSRSTHELAESNRRPHWLIFGEDRFGNRS